MGEYAENNSKDIYELEGLYLYKTQNTIEWQNEKK